MDFALLLVYESNFVVHVCAVPRFIGKTTEIPERPKNNREILMVPSANCKFFID